LRSATSHLHAVGRDGEIKPKAKMQSLLHQRMEVMLVEGSAADGEPRKKNPLTR